MNHKLAVEALKAQRRFVGAASGRVTAVMVSLVAAALLNGCGGSSGGGSMPAGAVTPPPAPPAPPPPPPPPTLSILTGSGGGAGRSDGVGANARFERPNGNAVDAAGNVYVADKVNQLIRKITPGGIVTTFAGTPRVSGATDGEASVARFCSPLGIAIDTAGFLYVTEGCNETIRKVSPAGVVSTLAGTAGKSGTVDGAGAAARFGRPEGIAVDAEGNLFVADRNQNTIRKISPGGNVTTVAGVPGVSGFADGSRTTATFSEPSGIAVDRLGNLYVTDTYNQTVRKITPHGDVSTLAGAVRVRGNVDGQGSTARFSLPTPRGDDFGQGPLSGIAVNSTGTIYLTDYYNGSIRMISPAGLVTTIAGNWPGYLDAQGAAAKFSSPTGISLDASGNYYVSEEFNFTVRKIAPSLVTSTLAGKPLVWGSADGPKGSASFSTPIGVAVDSAGNIYVADSGNNIIRKISVAGVTTTFAGYAGVGDYTDGVGPLARFFSPHGVAVDKAGNVYVSDARAHTIRKITPDGRVSTLAGGADEVPGHVDGVGTKARFFVPMGLAVDTLGNVYVADSFNSAVRKISPEGIVTTVNKGRAESVSVDTAGNVYVAGGNEIRKIAMNGTVTSLAGVAGMTGVVDGVGPVARFGAFLSLALDAAGNLYVGDGYCAIRKVTPAGMVSTIAGSRERCEVHEGPLPALVGAVTGVALGPGGELIFASNNAILSIPANRP